MASGALPALTHERDFERHLSVGRGGFTLHAATRAGAMDERGLAQPADVAANGAEKCVKGIDTRRTS